MADLVIALVGNPNSGKSSLFNALTGAHQHVGNWPGKTVEKKEGTLVHNGQTITVVDLPGAYSLTALSLEEVIARDFILEERPDVVVDVVDATNLERNLYMAVQLLELGANLVIALNVMDQARAQGIEIDIEPLSQSLGGVPVVPTVARRSEGVPELLDAVLRAASTRQTYPVKEEIA